MSNKIMPVKEFVDFGYLQEINRLFLHPLGLALTVIVDDEAGDCELCYIQDARDDPEGIMFNEEYLGTDEFIRKHDNVLMEWQKDAIQGLSRSGLLSRCQT